MAHLVENCIGITEVMGWNPVWTWIFFRPYLHYYLSSVHNYEDHFYIWSKYILVDLKDIEQTYRGIHSWKKEGSKVLKLNTGGVECQNNPITLQAYSITKKETGSRNKLKQHAHQTVFLFMFFTNLSSWSTCHTWFPF